mgnify:CR=1 FL=1
MVRRLPALLLLLLPMLPIYGSMAERPDSLLSRLFAYGMLQQQLLLPDTTIYVYNKFRLNVERRNLALLPVPTMWFVAHGARRAHLMETISRSTMSDGKESTELLLAASTFPHHRKAMEVAGNYLRPTIYNETMQGGALLSPFNEKNKRYYRYRVIPINDDEATVTFKSKVDNTQLVNGAAVMDNKTGRVISCFYWGEYDMLDFWVRLKMGSAFGNGGDAASDAEVATKFKFLGNRLSAYAQQNEMVDGSSLDVLTEKDNLMLMGTFRPQPLTAEEEDIYYDVYTPAGVPKSTPPTKGFRNFAKKVLWKTIGDNLVNRIKSNFGREDRGYFRLNPLLNPLYLGYSDKKGLYYKYDLRTNYSFSENLQAMLRMKGGYSLKQHQFYFQIPFVFFFDKQNNGYLKLEVNNGTWLRNRKLADKLIEMFPEGQSYDRDRLSFFKVLNWSMALNRDLSEKLGLQVGMVSRRRKAVEKWLYRQYEMPSSYRSTAPLLEFEYRPLGWSGPILTADYERSIKGFLRSKTEYERWELDGQYIQRLSVVKSVSYRAGLGWYTLKDKKNPYFLEFTNFRENNIPGGWNDDWSGEFELLDRSYYNESDYYIRANVTYESPLLLLSRLPLVGRYLETERLYGSALGVKGLFPYTEVGYGFTNKYFSMGLFVAMKEIKFDGIGFKFGLELFRDW